MEPLLIVLLVVAVSAAAVLGWLLVRRPAAVPSGEVEVAELSRLREAVTTESSRAAAAEARATALTGQLATLKSALDEAQDRHSDAQHAYAEQAAQLATAQATLHGERTRFDAYVQDLQARSVEQLAQLQSRAERDLSAAQADADRRVAATEKAAAERQALLEQTERRMADRFEALSNEALTRSQQAFLDLAEQRLTTARAQGTADLDARRQAVEGLVGPLADVMGKVEARIAELESARQQAYGSLMTQVQQMSESQRLLQTETAQLRKALRAPSSGGRWGEFQLRRVAEFAGMVNHCDFTEQRVVHTADGSGQRPDMVVHLPGGREVIVDAKVPLQAFLDGHESSDEMDRRSFMANHAKAVRRHVEDLSGKRYWASVGDSAEVTVLFMPSEAFLAAAMEADPGLFEHASARQILLASPTTLIALLQTIAFSWRQEALTDQARTICADGRELYRRISTMRDHFNRTGRSLEAAATAYNAAMGSLEARVLPAARRLSQHELADGPLDPPAEVQTQFRGLTSSDLHPTGPDEGREKREVRTADLRPASLREIGVDAPQPAPQAPGEACRYRLA